MADTRSNWRVAPLTFARGRVWALVAQGSGLVKREVCLGRLTDLATAGAQLTDLQTVGVGGQRSAYRPRAGVSAAVQPQVCQT